MYVYSFESAATFLLKLNSVLLLRVYVILVVHTIEIEGCSKAIREKEK